jgi:hypothetical protein
VRYAIYLTPPEDSPLERAAAAWLGRSAFGGPAMPPVAPAEADPATPARYGFHATLKAPFRLADGRTEADLLDAFGRFAGERAPLAVPLVVSRLSRFVALTAADHGPVQAACDAAVAAFEPFRAPLTAAERERRRPERLDEEERALLDRWGYPYVFGRFLFHMTLSGPVEEAALPVVEAATRAAFEPLLAVAQPLHFALYREEAGLFTVLAAQSVPSQLDA